MSNHSVRVLIKKPIGKIRENTKVTIPVDEKGIPLDFFWRKVIKDSKIDNSVEILDEKLSIDTTVASTSGKKAKTKKNTE